MKSKFYIIFAVFALAVMTAGVLAENRNGSGRDNDDSEEKNRFQKQFVEQEQRGRRGGGPGGPGGGREGRRGFGRGMFGPPMSTEELLAFLETNDLEKANQLKEMYNNQPEEYEKFIGIICELYTPASRIMENNPEIGKLMVNNISLSLDIKKLVSDYKVSKDDTAKDRLKVQLNKKLAQQFDVILMLQENEIALWQERILQFRERIESGDFDREGEDRGPGRGFGRGREMDQDRFEHMQKRMSKEVEKRKEDILKWKEQKDHIVNRQLSDLIEDVRPFPWNR